MVLTKKPGHCIPILQNIKVKMRRILFLAMLPSNALLALYNGNPSAPLLPERGMWSSERGWLGVKAGYQFNDQYDRKLHLVGQGISHLKKKVEKSDFKTQ